MFVLFAVNSNGDKGVAEKREKNKRKEKPCPTCSFS